MDNKILNINKLDSPALVVFPEIVQQNIKVAISMAAHPDCLRPHIKTHKTKEVIEFCQKEGIQKFKCATISEAEILGICAVKDTLLAYQPVGPKVNRWADLIQSFPDTQFSCLIDNLNVAQNLDKIGRDLGLVFSVYIDLNIGQNRTGILTENAIKLVEKIKFFLNISIIGLHAYDGHIYDIDFSIRKEKADLVHNTSKTVQTQLEKILAKNLTLVMSGSPTYSIHAKRLDIEYSPGTFVFWDMGYRQFTEQDFMPAVYVLGRVISKPKANSICVDIGHKSVAAERPLGERIKFLNAELQAISQSEEHLVLEVLDEIIYEIGDELMGIPYHICPTVALHEKIFLIENGKYTGNYWQVMARNRELNF